jgi:hypothetical protein
MTSKKELNRDLVSKRKTGSGARVKLSTSDKEKISNIANSDPKLSCAQIRKIAA